MFTWSLGSELERQHVSVFLNCLRKRHSSGLMVLNILSYRRNQWKEDSTTHPGYQTARVTPSSLDDTNW